MHWVFVALCRLSLVVASGGYSSLWYVGFSLWWLFLWQSTGSRHVGFGNYSTQAQQLWFVGPGARAQQLQHRGLVTLWHVKSSLTRGGTCVPCIGRRILICQATREAPLPHFLSLIFFLSSSIISANKYVHIFSKLKRQNYQEHLLNYLSPQTDFGSSLLWLFFFHLDLKSRKIVDFFFLFFHHPCFKNPYFFTDLHLPQVRGSILQRWSQKCLPSHMFFFRVTLTLLVLGSRVCVPSP